MKRKEVKKLTLKLSEGVLSTLTNLSLFTLFLVVESLGKPRSSYGVNLTFDAAWATLEDFNYETIKNSIIQLKKKGFINYQKKNLEKTLQITKEGRKRLKEIIPIYKTQRSWDNHIYLISYDVPEENRKDRQLLQAYVLKLGGVMLQKSFYLLPYNPTVIVKEFAKERGLEGTIIVSCIGKDGFIGEENINNLVKRVYQLEKLNQKYQSFVEKYKRGAIGNIAKIAFEFLSIVQDDPQLPFELLPKNWVGNEAFEIYQKSLPQTSYT